MARLTVNPGDIGAEIPDQPYGGNAPDISSNDNPQRDAIAQALINQQQQALMAPPAGGPGPEAAYYDLMRQRGSNPNAIGQQAALLGNAPPSMAPPRPDQSSQTQADQMAQYYALFAPKGQPSGSITDVGWMNALMPWQGGVSVGGQPGNPDLSMQGWTGGGSMTRADPNYWLGGGGGGGTGGLTTDDYNILLRRVGPDAMKSWIEGGGLSGTPGYGGMAGGGGVSGYGGAGPGGGGGRGGGPTGGTPSNSPPGVPQGPANPVGEVTRGPDLANLSVDQVSNTIGPTSNAFSFNPGDFGWGFGNQGFDLGANQFGVLGNQAFGGLGDDTGTLGY